MSTIPCASPTQAACCDLGITLAQRMSSLGPQMLDFGKRRVMFLKAGRGCRRGPDTAPHLRHDLLRTIIAWRKFDDRKYRIMGYPEEPVRHDQVDVHAIDRLRRLQPRDLCRTGDLSTG